MRLARVVKCEPQATSVAVTYDPAALFTGPDAVRLAASQGDAVTGDAYIFDPTADVFVGKAPIKAAITIHQVPPGWTGSSPRAIAELATGLQAVGGQAWLNVYFWLHFNADYVVSLEQYQGTAAP